MEAGDDLIEDEQVLMRLVQLYAHEIQQLRVAPPKLQEAAVASVQATTREILAHYRRPRREAGGMMDFFAIFTVTSTPVNLTPAAPDQVVVSAEDLLIATSYLAELAKEGRIRSWTAQKAFTNPEDGRFFVLDPTGPWTRWSNETDFHKEDPADGMTVREGYEILPLLGTMTDQALSKLSGKSVSALKAMRARYQVEGHRGTLRHYRLVIGGHVDAAFFKSIFRTGR